MSSKTKAVAAALAAADTTYLPIPVSDVDIAFGGKAMEILPPVSAIPDEFYSYTNKWNCFVSDWFFGGLKRYPVPREGVDFKLALRNLACVIGSFEPKHEHKEAGAAYLASLWFSSPDGELIKAKGGAA